ncbi:glycosyltransferase [Chitinophagaceae bacterium 26-R-25]|nr:glycosyltransferase [Chitinophagaceae bacterium 26-R-25]
MNYWLLTTEFPPFHGGGISTYCYFTVRMLVKSGIDVTVFVPDEKQNDFSINTTDGVRVVAFNPDRKNTSSYLGYAARLSYEFAHIVHDIAEKYGTPDVIESQDYLGIAYYLQQYKFLGWKQFSQVPIIITLHSPAFLYLEYNKVSTYSFPDFWTCEMEKQSIVMADKLISPSDFLKQFIQEQLQISEKQISVIVNPYEAGEQSFSKSFQDKKIVYYGKLSPQKGSFELLKYFKKLWDNGFTSCLNVIGGTGIVYHPNMQTMGEFVRSEYGEYIDKGLLKLHGKISPSQMKQHLSDAHVILVPSIVDNLPYVVLEAMDMGKVVLASVQGGQKEIITDGVNGFLFDHFIENDFENKLLQILSLSADEIGRIGDAAIARVRSGYSPQIISSRKIAEIELFWEEKKAGNAKFPFLYQEKTADIGYSNDERLTVIIPYYNMGKYIDECIGSVKNSVFSSIDIMIINDGSTDKDSVDRLAVIAKTHPEIKIVHQANKGLPTTRNIGAKLATGNYIAFLDADDKVDPQYYSKAIDVLKQYDNVFFVGSWVRYFGNTERIWPTFTPQPPYILVHNSVNSSALVYKREAFLQGGLNDKHFVFGLEDYDSVVSMLSKGFNGVVIPECLFYYRVRPNSMFRAITKNKFLYSNKAIAEKHAAYFSKFCIGVINLLNANGPGYLFDNPTFEVKVSSSTLTENKWKRTIKNFIGSNELLKSRAIKIKNKLKL